MKTYALPDCIPISSLNALEYCPRRFYYQFVQVETLVNEYVLEGTLLHRHAHQPSTRTIEGISQTTHLYLYSETLRLSGFADVIEEQGDITIPVEYKHGKQGAWLNDAIQLCAQALCLEERQPGKPPLSHGYIFYVGSRRRIRVSFTEELRSRTRAAIDQAFKVAALEQPPQPLDASMRNRCINCSLFPLCLPDEVKLLQSRKKEV